MVTLFLIVANPVYRESLAVTLAASGFRVAGTSGSGENPLSAVHELSPDVVFHDLPACIGLPILRALHYHRPGPAVVVLVGAGEEGDPFQWLREGASGLVLATESLHQLLLVIERVAMGNLRYSPGVPPDHLYPGGLPPPPPRNPFPSNLLTEREREIVSLIDRGLSNKEIAGALGIQLSTVKNHVHHVLEKLKARRRSEAAAQVAGRRAAL